MTENKDDLCDKSYSHKLIKDEYVAIGYNNHLTTYYADDYIKIETINDYVDTENLNNECKNETDCDKYFNGSDRLFECNLCHETFNISMEYNKHMKSHFQLHGLNFEDESDHKNHIYSMKNEYEINSMYKNHVFFDSDPQDIVEYDVKPIFSAHSNNSDKKVIENNDCLECEYCHIFFNTIHEYMLHISNSKCIKYHNRNNVDLLHKNQNKNVNNNGFSDMKSNAFVPITKAENKTQKLKLTFNNIEENQLSKKETNEKLWKKINLITSQVQSISSLACKICGKRFSNMELLKTHIAIHYDIYKYKCNKCDMLFEKLSDFKKHILNHKNENLLYCNICNKSFSGLSSKERHMITHSYVTSQSSTICDLCEKSFLNIEDLKIHIHEHTKEPIKCNVCDMLVQTSFQYKNHMDTHSIENYHVCNICKKNFTSITLYNKHKASHLIEIDTRCTVCGKTFRTNHNLKIHMRIHTLTRPYKCNICDKAFTQTSSHTIHMRTHTGERPYKCNICGKSFSQTGHHKTHMRIHIGLKPFKCFCSKSFSDYGNYIKHSRLHTGEQPFKCSECKKGFSRKKRLQMHMLLHGRKLEI